MLLGIESGLKNGKIEKMEKVKFKKKKMKIYTKRRIGRNGMKWKNY